MQFVRKVLAITSFLVLITSLYCYYLMTPEDEETDGYQLGVWDTILTQAPTSMLEHSGSGDSSRLCGYRPGFKGQPKNLDYSGRTAAAVRTARSLNVFASTHSWQENLGINSDACHRSL